MADNTTHGRHDPGSPVTLPFGFEALMDMHRPTLTAMAEVNGRVYDSLASINRSWVAFLNRRLKEDMAMPQQLAACKTVQEMYGVYSDFLQNAHAHYQAEFDELSRLGRSIADETLGAMQSRLEDGLRDGRPRN